MRSIKSYYDIVVVGGGPAGSTTARIAAQHGASVLIMERDREVGTPVRCAEGVALNTLKKHIKIDPKWIATEIDRMQVISPDGNALVLKSDLRGVILERRIFDPHLCDLAVQAGAEMITKANVVGLIKVQNEIKGVRYQYRGETKEVHCKIVIGADGVESRVGRWAGLNTTLEMKDIHTCVQYTVTGPEFKENTIVFYFGEEIVPGGYIWIFPKGKRTANIGLGITASMLKEKSPQQYLDDFMASHFPNAAINYHVCGGVPTSNFLTEYVTDQIMLVGDAARQVDPSTGGGIIRAIVAGTYAGEIAAKAIQKEDYSKKYLLQYAKTFEKHLGAKQKLLYELKKLYINWKDEDFNKLVKISKKANKAHFSHYDFFKIAARNNPKLLLQLAKAYAVSKF